MKTNKHLTIQDWINIHGQDKDQWLALIQKHLTLARTSIETGIFISVIHEKDLTSQIAALPKTGPLLGVPVAVKDNIHVMGLPTTAAHPDFAYQGTRDAFVVEELRKAGAIILGKTNLDQFATGLVGMRSPYPIPPNSYNPDYIPGGSSSGSAVAVATGIVPLALGTDTAGSGRIPAWYNGLVGYKPSCGFLSTRGVIPACRSIDCVSIFTSNTQDAQIAQSVLAVYDPLDPYARPSKPSHTAPEPRGILGLPRSQDLDFGNDPEAKEQWHLLVDHLKNLGFTLVEQDISPLLACAKLLYESAFVAERPASLDHVNAPPDQDLHPVTGAIIAKGRGFLATDLWKAQWQKAHYRRILEGILETTPFLVLPTAPRPYTKAEYLVDPFGVNTHHGTYTNFVNLLDMAALSIPWGSMNGHGLPWGCTLLADHHGDPGLFALAEVILGSQSVGNQGSHTQPAPRYPEQGLPPGWTAVAVCGAHLQGLPLNHQLTSRGGYLVREAMTQASYRMVLIPGPLPRPGLVAQGDHGRAFPVEIWAIPSTTLGSFLQGIAAPLGLGQVNLAEGHGVLGFISCEAQGTDISSYGGWKAYLKAQ